MSPLILTLCTFFIFSSYHVYSYPGEVVYGCAYNNKQIHLTFDDGPTLNNNRTEIVLNVLKEYNISATFFVVGNKVNATNRTIHLIKRMIAEGHTVGSHTWSHPNLLIQSDEVIKRQIDATTNVLQPILGYKPNLFRAPYGGLTDNVLKYLKQEGYTAVQWNIGNNDWYYNPDVDAINEATMSGHARIGGIITMHDSAQGNNNGDSLRHLIQILTNDTSYVPPFQVYNTPNFKLVGMLECLDRDDINDIPDAYIVQSVDTEDRFDAVSVYWIGSVVFVITIIVSVLVTYYCTKKANKRVRGDNSNEKTQLVPKSNIL